MRLPSYIVNSILLFAILLFPYLLSAQYKFYFGNIHAHSSYSDGCHDCDDGEVLTPKKCFKFAKQSKNFDFLGISEHNHRQAGMKDTANYLQGLEDANDENDNGNFVCMYGMEFGTNEFGHVLVYGVDKLVGWDDKQYQIFGEADDYVRLWKLINTTPNAFATLAHPETKQFNNLVTKARSTPADNAICGTAIRNGPHSSESVDYDDAPATSYYGYYKRLLALGYRIGPTIDHDNHNTTFGRTAASRTVLLARKLHRDSLIAAYKAMRFYASEDWNTEVTFTIKEKCVGSQFSTKTRPVIRVKVKDSDDADSVKYIKILYGKAGSKLAPTALGSVANIDHIIVTHETAKVGETFYYFAEIKQHDGDLIITAPIWVKRIN